MKRIYSAVPLMSFVLACGPVPDPHTAVQVPAPNRAPTPELAVTVEELFSLSSPATGALSFRFANEGSDFLHVDRVLLNFGSQKEDESVAILSGRDLETWSQGIVQRNRERQYRRDLALLGVAMAVDVLGEVGSVAHSQRLRFPPAGATQFALAATSLEEESNSAGALYPDAHLFAVPFGVPPKLGVSRWVALHTRDSGAACVHFVSVRVLVRERGWLQFATTFRGVNSPSEWQVPQCAPDASATNRDVR